MTRPHIEYIQAQGLPWRRGLYGRARPDVRTRILSIDRKNGDSSVLIKYPAGWKRTKKEYLTADEELFVLDGALKIAGIEYGKHCYAYLPAGYERPRASSKEGAVVLTFFNATPTAVAGRAPKGMMKKKRLVELLDTGDMPWDAMPGGGEMDPEIGGMNAIKTLRIDHETEDFTFLYGAMPQSHPDGWTGKIETHPVVEEMYLISGELAGNTGIMRPGAYFWRPPGILHGPYGTETGAFGFFRTLGGMLVNIWTDYEVKFTYDPRYKPALPRDLKKYARETRPASASY